MGGFALYSHTKIQKFRETTPPRVISLNATGGMGGSTPELAPLKGELSGGVHRTASGGSGGGAV